MNDVSRVVIVGAGQAGASVAVALRDEGFGGSLTLIGAEPHLPYERPPLSKAYLRGETSRDDARLQSPGWWAAQGIDLRTGTAVERIDPAGRSLDLADGSGLGYDRLVLALGSDARRLEVPGADLDGVLTLRTFEDADRIRDRAQGARRVLVIGGGWIGSEVAASLRQMGVPVTLALSGDLPLERALGRSIAEVYDGLHREHGVAVLPRTRVVELEGDDGRVRRARTETADMIEADVVVAAVGARPRLQLALSAGLAVSGGIVVDGLLRTSDPAVLAVGDVAEVPHPHLGRSLRVEHWGAAQSQGAHAARTILGHRDSYAELPYFFSDQYDTGMEFWGDPALPGDLVVRGDRSVRSFTAFWVAGRLVRAALNMHVHHHAHAEHGHTHDGPGQQSEGQAHGNHAAGAEAAHGDATRSPAGGAATAHAGGHVDPEVVGRLIRSGRPVDPAALADSAVGLEQLVPART